MSQTESFLEGGVPVILRHPKDPHETAPLIVLWHGLGPPDSESALCAALPLDQVHAYKAYLGLPLCGARRPTGGVAEMLRRQNEDYLMQIYFPILHGAVRELPGVVEALRARARLRLGGGIGLFGFALGGAAAELCLIEGQVGIAAAAILNAPKNPAAAVADRERLSGVPYTWTAAARAAAKHADPLGRAADIAHREPPPALLLLNGADDEHFPPAETRTLRDALRPHYEQRGYPEWLAHQTLPGLCHHIGPVESQDPFLHRRISASAQVDKAVGDWFQLHLDRLRF